MDFISCCSLPGTGVASSDNLRLGTLDMKGHVLNQAGKFPSALNDIVWAFDLGRAFFGDLPSPRWGMRQRMCPAMNGSADLRVSRPCRTGHLGVVASPPDQSNQTGWNRESREPRETAQHRRCDLFVEGPKIRHAFAPGPKARNVIAQAVGLGCQIKFIFRGLKGRPNNHAADGPALQAGRRWGVAGSRAFSPGYYRTGLQPASNEVWNTVAVRQHHLSATAMGTKSSAHAAVQTRAASPSTNSSN
jgi:hypothetical protein